MRMSSYSRTNRRLLLRKMPCWPTNKLSPRSACPTRRLRVVCGTACAAGLFREKVGDSKLIEGWIEGPCAEAADLRGINTLMIDFFDDPDFVRELFEFTLQLGIRFAREQVQAGVDIIGVGDAAASLIGPQFYEQFVWPFEKRLVEELHAMGTRVRLHICGNICPLLEKIGKLECDIVDLDFMVPVDQARKAMGPDQVLLEISTRYELSRTVRPSRSWRLLASAIARRGRVLSWERAAKSHAAHLRKIYKP